MVILLIAILKKTEFAAGNAKSAKRFVSVVLLVREKYILLRKHLPFGRET